MLAGDVPGERGRHIEVAACDGGFEVAGGAVGSKSHTNRCSHTDTRLLVVERLRHNAAKSGRPWIGAHRIVSSDAKAGDRRRRGGGPALDIASCPSGENHATRHSDHLGNVHVRDGCGQSPCGRLRHLLSATCRERKRRGNRSEPQRRELGQRRARRTPLHLLPERRTADHDAQRTQPSRLEDVLVRPRSQREKHGPHGRHLPVAPRRPLRREPRVADGPNRLYVSPV
jgi:hypothetical protein